MTDLGFLRLAIDRAGADAFVHVGDRFDDDLRYLTGFSGPDRAYALVVTPDEAVLCAPRLFEAQAERKFCHEHSTLEERGSSSTLERRVATSNAGSPAGQRAVAVLDDALDRRQSTGEGSDATLAADSVSNVVADSAAGSDADSAAGSDADSTDGAEVIELQPNVIVPQQIPHDAVAYLQRGGYEVSSTTAVTEARTVKTDDELDELRAVQAAAVAGMARAESILAGTTVDRDDAVLRWEGDPLTTERLRRAVNAELARQGVESAGNTVIGAGPSAADLHFTGTEPIRPGETVLLDLSPRGPNGYYGDLSRTFVVDSDGGWDRRAYVAVQSAREAALAEVHAGIEASTVHTEAAAELQAYGFDPRAGEGEAGFTHGVGHGVGLCLHEAPSLTSDVELQEATVVSVEPGVYDPERGGVRIEDLVVVTATGYELLAEAPIRMAPESNAIESRAFTD